MDTGRGNFVTAEDKERLREMLQEKGDTEGVERLKRNDGVFQEGEELEIRGSLFRIQSIKQRGRMTLKLLPRPAA